MNGTELAERRRAVGVDQETLARWAGLSTSTLSRIERGVQEPTDRTMDRLLNAIAYCASKDQAGGEAVTRYLDPDTSHKAARGARPWTEQILDAFKTYPGLADDELCTVLRVPPRQWPTVKAARSRLSVRSNNPNGILCDSGVRRKNRAGREQIVWMVKE